MEKKMKRRSYVRVVSFAAALAAVLVTASICGNVRASKYKKTDYFVAAASSYRA